MKKTTNLLIALAAGIGVANAGPVTLSVAQKAATNFYGQTSHLQNKKFLCWMKG